MDEASITDNRYMVIGGIWLPLAMEDALRSSVRQIKAERGTAKEFKWANVTERRLEAYKDMVNLFFDTEQISFRCIVIDKTVIDYNAYHNNNKEQGFYKFYFQLISRCLIPGNAYWAYLDDRVNKEANRLPDLKRYVNNWCKRQHKCSEDLLRVVEPRDSQRDELVQMADILSGAVAGKWNGAFRSEAKSDFCDHIAGRKGWKTLKVATFPKESKFNIWKWEPKE